MWVLGIWYVMRTARVHRPGQATAPQTQSGFDKSSNGYDHYDLASYFWEKTFVPFQAMSHIGTDLRKKMSAPTRKLQIESLISNLVYTKRVLKVKWIPNHMSLCFQNCTSATPFFKQLISSLYSINCGMPKLWSTMGKSSNIIIIITILHF